MGRLAVSLCLLLLIAAAGWAGEDVGSTTLLARSLQIVGGRPAAAAACTTPAGDELSEGFPATPDNTWTAAILTPTYGHTLQAGAPDGSCATGLNLVTSTSDGRERIYWNRGSTIAANVTTDIKFSFYLNSSGIDAGTGRAILGWASTNEGSENALILKKTADGLSDELYCTGAAGSSNFTIATATWYEVTIHLDATAASSYCQVTGGSVTACDAASECTFTRHANASQYLVIGRNTYHNDAFDIEIGYLTINTP